ncbi:hypothetical protein [Saccharopolyspora antimicrobica]|uniref:Tetratricopeptide repeat protein n=2 Tax=Saccharopolyspora antimicrobica TaxID=455193 RepID=A0ABX9THB6_9PSEU|nr:hypothetical protein [Saccharopolyspora antimicrobica]RKT86420.1 hypothetical protein ATL45_4787 [Saccharopolyspora antimicrobica]
MDGERTDPVGQAAWRLQLGVQGVLATCATTPDPDSYVEPDQVAVGDLEHARMELAEVAPALLTDHLGVVEQVRRGLDYAERGDTEGATQELVKAWQALTDISGKETRLPGLLGVIDAEGPRCS